MIVRREIAATCVTARFSAVDRILRWTSLETGRSEPLIIVDAILRVMAIQLRETRGQKGKVGWGGEGGGQSGNVDQMMYEKETLETFLQSGWGGSPQKS